MEAVLDLLVSVTPASAKAAGDLLAPELFASSSAQQKHKLKTRISALLKSSGTSRALGAVLARRALVDWSIVKTHGVTWAPILLHILDLPDRVCWVPAVRALTFLYTQVHGKADLLREIGSSKIGEFMKRLLKILPQTETKLFFAVTRMLQLYPTQCRPYLNKLAPLLNIPGGEQALASLCLAEKAGPEIWRQRFSELLSQLEENNPDADAADLVRAHQLAQLREYVLVAADVKARIPAARLVRVISTLLKSYKPLLTARVLHFMLATRAPLETLYTQSFDLLVYSLVDCVDLGTRLAVEVAEFMAWELRSVGWASENYSQVLTRLTKKLLATSKKQFASTGAEGLADYVQNPSSFKQVSLTGKDTAALARYFSAVVLCVPTIPQSVRTQIDYYILANGTDDEVVKATVYAGRFSILPLAIHERLPNLHGLETMVHPRFPPLNTSQYALQVAQSEPQEDAKLVSDQQDKFGTVIVAESTQEIGQGSEAPASSIEEDDLIEDDQVVDEKDTPLPPIPESVKPVHRTTLDDIPPKRQKISEPESESVTQITSTVSVEADVENNEENNEDDSDNELVIPTLTMDSD